MTLSLLALANRQFIRLVAGSFLLAGATACSSSTKEEAVPANLVTRNDFEAVEGWGVVSPSLTKAKARSGRYAIKVDGETEFSIGYQNTLLQVSNSKLKKLHVRGWALLTGPQAKAVLVVQVTDPAKGGEQVYWEALDIRGEVKTLNHWTQVDKDFVLPATIGPNQELKIYMWRTGPDDATYLDDLEITKG
ncbi:carbohydrate binding domain-containing protein [Hymenobacter sp. IS2118]|uniref:carbohydrate binding domain-containing protein n=1 Tax=Hymenobacter sp. IS2118 TaxID=1505605 RepID=UPI000554D6AB|nr:carbohydrate binding domain-containing protein [Hymenobacter sp. IS2118]